MLWVCYGYVAGILWCDKYILSIFSVKSSYFTFSCQNICVIQKLLLILQPIWYKTSKVTVQNPQINGTEPKNKRYGTPK